MSANQTNSLVAIILGAGPGVRRLDNEKSAPKSLLRDNQGNYVLDWSLNAFNRVGVDKVVYVGGFHIEKVMENYPHLTYYYNQYWEKTQSLASLKYALHEINGRSIICYSDIVFRAKVLEKLLANSTSKDGITVVVDRHWHNRYARRITLETAFKVSAENNHVKRIGRKLEQKDNILGEFIGMIYLSPKGCETFKRYYAEFEKIYANQVFHEEPNFDRGDLACMIQEMAHRGVNVDILEIEGDWAELDAPQDLAQFVFGTKAETLDRLQGLLKKGRICDLMSFTTDEWNKNQAALTRKIQNQFKENIIIRSSCAEEDSWESSMAGNFTTIFDVDVQDPKAIENSIQKVISGYSNEHAGHNQVLIQPFIRNVVLSGVIFARDLETGAPYYICNYDDTTRRTDTITSGMKIPVKSFILYKHNSTEIRDQKLKGLLDVVYELETLIGHGSLDIEFALTDDGHYYIFQVRPLVAKKNAPLVEEEDMNKELSQIADFLSLKCCPQPGVLGKTTIFGIMPDWNPAEIIGIKPHPLAFSLYKYLITDHIWSDARAEMGYIPLTSVPLIYSFGGHPYVDIRSSLNSFLPAGISRSLGEKIVDLCLQRLKSDPTLHDKIEFDLTLTCLSFDFDAKIEAFKNEGGFTSIEIAQIKEGLLKLTNNIIANSGTLFKNLHTKISQLTSRRNYLQENIKSEKKLPMLIYHLLEDCKQFGTLPFSIFARCGFIAASFLKSLPGLGLISHGDMDQYLRSIPTVASNFSADCTRLKTRELSLNDFLNQYGHLRPGTYDILSPRYADEPNTYFPWIQDPQLSSHESEGGSPKHIDIKSCHLPADTLKHIERLLKDFGFTFTVDTLLEFIQESIKGREFAKFEFTKNLSLALKLIADFGEHIGLSPEMMSFIPIHDILPFAHQNLSCAFEKRFKSLAEEGKNYYLLTRAIHLPHLISSANDIYYFELPDFRPNYITQKSVRGEIVCLDNGYRPKDISGKIVLIESADPGYDWIFSGQIKGLITAYGGANSHMAIRAAEFSLPASIGCGENLYQKISRSRYIELNCGTKQMAILQ